MERNLVKRLLRVLVIDDCEDTTASLSWLLRAWGFDPLEANSGRDALSLAPSFRPDVALIDLMMPRMDGWAVARAFRERAVRVVILSGCNDAEHGSGEAGYALHMRKPFDLEKLHRFLSSTELELFCHDAEATRPPVDESRNGCRCGRRHR